jgi:hypothetical protein
MILGGSFLTGLGIGAIVGGSVVYFALLPHIKLKSLQASIEARKAAWGEITMDRIPGFRQEGIVRKRYYLVIQERLLNNKLPISPFWEYKFLVSERLDPDDLTAVTNTLATVADKILGLADIKQVVLDMIKAKSGRRLSKK